MISLEALQSLSSPLGAALTEVFASCLKEVLSEYSYYADCAGLQYDVKLTKGGLELMFFGYHHKLPVLVSKVVNEMKKMGGETPCPGDCYSRVKEKVLRSYYNYRFWSPYYHCLLGFATCLEVRIIDRLFTGVYERACMRVCVREGLCDCECLCECECVCARICVCDCLCAFRSVYVSFDVDASVFSDK